MIFATPKEHNDNPPSSWIVKRVGAKWGLFPKDSDTPLDMAETKAKAESLRTAGFMAELYEKEGRWFKGEKVDGWRPWTP